MPRQRSKRLTESRKNGTDLRQVHVPESDHESVHSQSVDESVDIEAKDDEEEELDRLVLGDGAGFKAQLGNDFNVGYKDRILQDEESIEEDEEAEGGLENVDDADVSKTPRFARMIAEHPHSFSSSMRDRLRSTRLL
jgi:U3 small nucleolar RNA-associated protein 18